MRIHNLLEEVVLDKIAEITAESNLAPGNSPDLGLKQKLDIACFVLNRLTPLYMVSGRGLAYMDLDYVEKLQRDADMVALIHQGIERVRTVKRPYYDLPDEPEAEERGVFWNFPVIRGRILASANFEPVFGMDVSLNMAGVHAKMIDPSWLNPYPIPKNTAGMFLFWPYPGAGLKPGERKNFEFELVASRKGCDEIRHFFELTLVAESGFIDYFRANRVYRLKDLYLMPEEA